MKFPCVHCNSPDTVVRTRMVGTSPWDADHPGVEEYRRCNLCRREVSLWVGSYPEYKRRRRGRNRIDRIRRRDERGGTQAT